MNETLEAMARAIFDDWFVDFSPARARMEGLEPYLAPEVWRLFPDRRPEAAAHRPTRRSPVRTVRTGAPTACPLPRNPPRPRAGRHRSRNASSVDLRSRDRETSMARRFPVATQRRRPCRGERDPAVAGEDAALGEAGAQRTDRAERGVASCAGPSQAAGVTTSRPGGGARRRRGRLATATPHAGHPPPRGLRPEPRCGPPYAPSTDGAR